MTFGQRRLHGKIWAWLGVFMSGALVVALLRRPPVPIQPSDETSGVEGVLLAEPNPSQQENSK